MLIGGALCLLGIVGIAAAFITADRFFHINGPGIVFENTPKEVFIICANFIFRSEKTFCKTVF